MNKIIKKIIITLLLSTISLSTLLAQSASFDIVKGNINSFNIYNESGEKIKINSQTDIPITGKIIFQTQDEPVVLNYTYGTLEIDANSLLVVDPFSKEPILYLIDGNIILQTDSEIVQNYKILTPVSEYNFNSPANINVISTDKLEYGIFYKGQGTSYNALTAQTTQMFSSQMINMAYPDNFSITIPSGYEENKVNYESNDSIDYVSQVYVDTDNEIMAKKRDLSEQNRINFLNGSYLLGIKPIQKSNNFDKITTINFVITGNGQGNINSIDLAALSGIIKEAKNNNANILLIDGGNTINGSPYVSFDKGKTAIKVLDKIGYDIFVPGPIDFSYGINRLSLLSKSSNINFISTNALNKNQLFYFNPYGLYLFDDFKIAVLGLSSPSDTTAMMDLDLTNKIIIDNAQTAIDKAREVADYVVLVSNINYNKFDSEYILNKLNGIDLVIDSNNSDATLMSIDGVPLINTGVGYSEIQNYTINVKDEKVISSRYAKVYSSNLEEEDNRLLTSLNINSFRKDKEILDILNNITIPSNLSAFVVEPKITNVSTTINTLKITSTTSNLNLPKIPQFAGLPLLIPTLEDNLDDIITTNIKAPKFKDIAYKVKKETPNDIIIKNTVEPVEDIESKSEPTDASLINNEPKKANIYTGEDLKIKTHIGLNSDLSAKADVNSLSISDIDYSAYLSLYPYVSYDGFSFGLKLSADIDQDLNYNLPLYPFPTSASETSEYIVNLIDHLKIVNNSGSFDLQINRNTFNSNINSGLLYNSIGGSDLHLISIIDTNSFNLTTILSNLDIYKPLSNTTSEDFSLFATFKPADLLNINLGAIAKGNNSTLDVYPSLNFNFIPVNNKDIQVNFNLGATLYFEALPTLNFQTILNTGSLNLIPNYLANTSLEIKSNTLDLSIGATYLITEDSNKFTSNMIHKNTINSDIFTAVNSNTLSAIAKIGYSNDKIDLSTVYTLPFKLNSMSLDKDLFDLSLDLKFGNLSLGGFYLYNDFINHLKTITNIKAFLVNDYTEYGGYFSYSINDLTLKTSISLPASTSVPLSVVLSLKYNLDYTL